MRYHARRRAFCEQLDRFGTACSFIFGTAGFGAVALKWPVAAGIATGLVAVLGALVLAFGVADAWRQHANLFRRWGEVRAGLAALPPDDEAGLRQLEVKKAEIDLESPPQLSALSVLVENEEKETREDTSLYHVPLVPRIMADFMDVPGWKPKPVRELEHHK
jgi:hypothetical protein